MTTQLVHARDLIYVVNRDWDLWGPLLLCLLLGIMLSINVRVPQSSSLLLILITHPKAPPSQSLGVFTSIIVICSLGALAVTVQAKVRSLHDY